MLEELDKSHTWHNNNFEKLRTTSRKKSRPKAVLLNMKNNNAQRYLEKIEIHKDEQLLPITSLKPSDLTDGQSDTDLVTDNALLLPNNNSITLILPDSAIDRLTDSNLQQSSTRTVPNILRTNTPKMQSYSEVSSFEFHNALVNNFNTSKPKDTLGCIELTSESMIPLDAIVVQGKNTRHGKRSHKRKQVYNTNNIRQDTSDWNNDTVTTNITIYSQRNVTPDRNDETVTNDTTVDSQRNITFDRNDETVPTEMTIFPRRRGTRRKKTLSVNDGSTVPMVQNNDPQNTNNTIDTTNDEPDDKSAKSASSEHVSPLPQAELCLSQVKIDPKLEETIDCLNNDIFNKYCYECFSDNPVNYLGEFVAHSNELTYDNPAYGYNTYNKNCDINGNSVSNETSEEAIFDLQKQKDTILSDQFLPNEPNWMKNIKFGNEINLGSIFQCDFCNDYSEKCVFCSKDNNNCIVDGTSLENNKNLSDTTSSRIESFEDAMQIITDDRGFKEISEELAPEKATEQATVTDDFKREDLLEIPETNTGVNDFDSRYIDNLINCGIDANVNDTTDTMLLALLNEAFPNHNNNNDNDLINDILHEETSEHDNNKITMSTSSSVQGTDSDTSCVVCLNEKEINRCPMRSKTVKRDRGVYQCDLCLYIFSSRRGLSLHRTGAHGGLYYYSCDHCGRFFNNQYTFSRHSIHCDFTEPLITYNCAECEKTYRYKSSLMQHLQNVHNREHPPYRGKRFACDKCSKTYVRLGAYRNHLKIHEAGW